MNIVSKYFNENEIKTLTKNGLFNSLIEEYDVKVTGKYPVIIKNGYQNYHVKCRKTVTQIIFDIWFAV